MSCTICRGIPTPVSAGTPERDFEIRTDVRPPKSPPERPLELPPKIASSNGYGSGSRVVAGTSIWPARVESRAGAGVAELTP